MRKSTLCGAKLLKILAWILYSKLACSFAHLAEMFTLNGKKKENNIMPKILHVVVRDVKELSSAAHNVQRKTIYKSITNEIYYP